MKKFISICFLAVITTTFTGCMSVGNDTLAKETEQSVGNKIIKGKTTKQQIRSMFGSPLTTNFTDSGLTVWEYRFTKSKNDLMNFGVSMLTLGFGTKHQSDVKELKIIFDDNNVVKNYNMSESEVSAKSGILNL